MRSSVRAAFAGFNKPIEGYVRNMYLDVKSLVTTGVGNLIDPKPAAMGLPWVYKSDGSTPASSQAISAEWDMVKSRTDLAPKGGGYFAGITTLMLTDDAIDSLILSRLDANETYLRKIFPDWDDWPADAQMGTLSMAWANGPGFDVPGPHHFPKFIAAANDGDWVEATIQSKLSEAGNAGVHPRNVANATMFANAAQVVQAGADPSVLHYPARVDASTLPKKTSPIVTWGAGIVVATIAAAAGWEFWKGGKS